MPERQLRARLRRRLASSNTAVADVEARALRWARGREARWRGRNPWVVAMRVTRNAVDDRVGGLAAEMSFWALLSLLPLLVTIAALLGYAERIVGAEQLRSGQQALVSAGSLVFSRELTGAVVEPFVSGVLREGRGGVAVTSLVVALYLASRVFTATIRALDLAYRVPERRGLVHQRLVAVAMAAGFVLLVVAALVVLVLGPLLGSGQALADWTGFGGAYAAMRAAARWPVMIVLMVGFLAAVYHWGPNVVAPFRAGLPGAILGVAAWLLASAGLRLYLEAGGGGSPGMSSEDQAVALVARAIGTVIAVLLWTYVTGVAILLGGELNAELARSRAAAGRSVRPLPASETMRSHDGGGATGG